MFPADLCQSPYFIFALFTLLTSLLAKYSHSHPPYYLRYLRYLTIFIRLAQHHHAHPLLTVRNVTKIPLFSPNFFLTLITYGLLSYSVCLYCANIHTPLLFSFLSLRFSDHEDKASRSILLGRSRTTVLQVLVVIILKT